MLEHREVLEVPRGELSVNLFRRCSDCEIGDANTGVTPTPTAPKLSRAERYRLPYRDPSN